MAEEGEKTFYDYDIDNKIKIICKSLGYLKPSEVQKDLINQVLLKKATPVPENLVISSKAGSGKTFCYLLYLLNKIDLNLKKLQVVILVPTRELAMQTVSYLDRINNENVLEKNSDSDSKINYKLLIGGRNLNDRHETGTKDIEGNSQIIVGTLGKIYSTFSSLISNKNKKQKNPTDSNNLLENFKCLIIDEADKLICQNKTGSLENLLKLFLNPEEKENKNRYKLDRGNKISLVLSSASFDKRSMNFYLNYVNEFVVIKSGAKNKNSNEDKSENSSENFIQNNIKNETQHNQASLTTPCKDTQNKTSQNIIKQFEINSYSEVLDNIKEYYHVFTPQIKTTYFEQKYQKLFEILNHLKNDFKQCLIFYNQKGRGEELASDLRDFGWSTTFIHGDLNQDQRILIYEKIKNIQVKIILATDLFSRGIDLSTVDLVINFDMPYNSVEYYHRVGRTGRYNSYGVSLTFLNDKEKEILQDIESNSNQDTKLKVSELKKLDVESLNLLKEDLIHVQEKNVMSKDIQEKVKFLDIETKAEISQEKETEFLNKKRRGIQYEKESIISQWVETETKLFEVDDFNYYEENIEGKTDNEIENVENIENNENKCQFCLYCNLFKIFEME